MKKSRLISIALIVLVILGAVLAYNKFAPAPAAPSAINHTVYTATATTTNEADTLLRQLHDLQTVTLDTSVLTSPAFTGLVDFSRPLVRPTAGRTNPFAPINPFEPLPSDGVRITSTSTTPHSTSTPH